MNETFGVKHRVSDHALVRYVQRVCGLDMDTIQKKMWMARLDPGDDSHVLRFLQDRFGLDIEGLRREALPPFVMASAKFADGSPVNVRYGGNIYVFRDGTLVTILFGRMKRLGQMVA